MANSQNAVSEKEIEQAIAAKNLEGNGSTALFTRREWILRYATPFKALLFMAGPMILIVLSNALYGIIDKELTLNYAVNQVKEMVFKEDGTATGLLKFYSSDGKVWVDIIKDGQDISTFSKQLINVSTQFSGTVIALLSALSMITSVGTSIRFGQLMGARDKKAMDNVLVTGFLQTLILSALTILIFSFVNPYIITSQAGVSYGDRDTSLQYILAHDFTSMYTFGFPLLAVSTFLVTMLRSEGKVWWVIGIQLTSVVINIIMGIVFMEKMDLGMKGAVYGSMVAWGFSILASLTVIGTSKNTLLIPNIKKFRPQIKDVGAVWINGIASFVMMLAFATISYVSTILINSLHSEADYTNIEGSMRIEMQGAKPEYVSVSLRILSSTQPWLQILYAPVTGIVQGGGSIIAYNYGAEKHVRIKKINRMSIYIAVGWAVIALVIMMIAREPMMAAFDGPEGKGWWFVFNYIAFPAAGIVFTTIPLANGTKNNLYALLITASRSFGFQIIMMVIGYFVTKSVSADGAKDWVFFLCYGMAELLAGVLSLTVWFLLFRKFKKNGQTTDVPDTFVAPSYFDAVENELNIAIERDENYVERHRIAALAKISGEGENDKQRIELTEAIYAGKKELSTDKITIKKINAAINYTKKAHAKYKTDWKESDVLAKQMAIVAKLHDRTKEIKSEISTNEKSLRAVK